MGAEAIGTQALSAAGSLASLLTLSGDSGPWILYHYTTPEGMNGILSSGYINPSLGEVNPNDARYGDGQYFTDIPPQTMSQGQLSRALVGVPWAGDKFTNYVGVNVQGLNVTQGRPNVYVVPNKVPLNVQDRIFGSGAN